MALLPLRSILVVRCSPRSRRCSSATRSAHPRLWLSVYPVGVGHSEPPVKGSRLRSLEPLCPRRIQAPTQKQEALSSTSEGRVAPSAVGQGSSLVCWIYSRTLVKSGGWGSNQDRRNSRNDLCHPTPRRYWGPWKDPLRTSSSY